MSGVGLLLIFAVGLALRAFRSRPGERAFDVPGEGRDRVVVEVINTTDVQGLARAATLALRRNGVDVVYFGSAEAGAVALDSTEVLIRRERGGQGTGRARALRVARSLGLPETRVALRPDSTRLVDASVLVGRDLAARLDFHP